MSGCCSRTSTCARPPAFELHGEAEFWNFEFNRILTRRRQGVLLADPRVLN
jgi:hypothetical protein